MSNLMIEITDHRHAPSTWFSSLASELDVGALSAMVGT